MSGSTVTIRARESTAHIASMPAMHARINWRFSSAPRDQAEGMEPPDLPGRPREERQLVDRRVDRHGVVLFAQIPGDGAAIAGKPIDERRREHVHVVRVPVVAQVPDDLHALLARCRHGVLEGGEVEHARRAAR